jgi:hypothetical protein
MRLRFWRKTEPAVFDAAAGEVPEHLEVYPLDKPFPWRAMVIAGAAGVISFAVLVGWRALERRHADPGPLVAVEAASLAATCADSIHFHDLYDAAPCDANSRAELGVDRIQDYYVVIGVHLGSEGHVSRRRAYLILRACYERSLNVLAPIDDCVVSNLSE